MMPQCWSDSGLRHPLRRKASDTNADENCGHGGDGMHGEPHYQAVGTTRQLSAQSCLLRWTGGNVPPLGCHVTAGSREPPALDQALGPAIPGGWPAVSPNLPSPCNWQMGMIPVLSPRQRHSDSPGSGHRSGITLRQSRVWFAHEDDGLLGDQPSKVSGRGALWNGWSQTEVRWLGTLARLHSVRLSRPPTPASRGLPLAASVELRGARR